MPNDETKKTKSAHSTRKRQWTVRVLILLAVIIGVGLLYLRMYTDEQVITLNRHQYHVRIMQTEAEREQGLSGTKRLDKDEAMLFVFPTAAKWGMWMKDMNYPIDIVWLNDMRQIIYSVQDATPSSYPTVFKPLQPARYVIELPSGTIEKTGIVNGLPAGFPSSIQ